MNSFTTIVTLCVVMAASCSGAYKTQSWATQPVAVPAPAPHTTIGGYGNKPWGSSNVVSAPAAAPQTYSVSAPAPLREASPAPAKHSFPTTTQQICTCVAVPAGASAASSTSATAIPLERPQQTAQQTYSAPAVAPASVQPTVFRPAAQHSGY